MKPRHIYLFLTLISVLALAMMAWTYFAEDPEVTDNPTILSFAEANGLDPALWPMELAALLECNPETEDFVLNYPLLRDDPPEIDLAQYRDCTEVPLLLQWDARWGYSDYGGSMMGLSGCGPTCLSMVCLYLLGDTRYDPLWLAQFSEKNGWRVPGAGSSWELISQGGPRLGLQVSELPLDKNRILRELRVGHPIVCAMGPGDFTSTGHFILLTGCDDTGLLQVNDPNSPRRSAVLWDFEEIKSQFRNLWACQKVP